MRAMGICEPTNEDLNPSVTLRIPLRFYLSGKRDFAEYKRIALEDLRIKSGQVLELIQRLGIEQQGSSELDVDFAENIILLSAFGKGLNETLEEVEAEKERDHFPQKETANQEPKTEESVLDLSDHTTPEDGCIDLAKHISAVLKNPKTPREIKDALNDGLSSMDLSDNVLYSTEHIVGVLREAGCFKPEVSE